MTHVAMASWACCLGIFLGAAGLQATLYNQSIERQRLASAAERKMLQQQAFGLTQDLTELRKRDFEHEHALKVLQEDCTWFEGEVACSGRQLRSDLMEHVVPFHCDRHGCAWNDCGAPR